MAETGNALAAVQPARVHYFEDLQTQKEAASLGMWLFLVTEVMFFGGLFLAYAVYRALYPAAFAHGSHLLSWELGAFNTFVLILSSLTMALGVHAAATGRRKATSAYLLLTILLGSAFLGVKVVEYKDKFDHHLVPGPSFGAVAAAGADAAHGFPPELSHAGQIYFSLYFAMTGLHAVHMLAGIPLLAWLALAAWRGHYTAEYHVPVENVGLYWHFVDIVWIFLFPLLYLIH